MFDLSGRTALVTGASQGLGHRFAELLAEHGARVGLAARNLDKCQELQRRSRPKVARRRAWPST